jgi:60 kDa SS-A/Ro ribonucleoprotein
MMNLRAHYSTRNTPQDEPIPGKAQVKNNAGGYAFAVDDWSRLDRFLVLGTAGGTYYVGERKLTVENAECVRRCIAEDGVRVVNRVVEISQEGRAPKNDPALFALAMCAAAEDLSVRQAALAALPRVARIGTHLFHFAEYVEGFRGWGRALKNAVGRWYTEMPTDRLALQVVKYQQRDGWSHRDLLRLAHPETDDAVKKAVFDFVCRPDAYGKGEKEVPADFPQMLIAAHALKNEKDVKAISAAIRRHRLPREVVPTEALNSAEVWHALLEDMPIQAMVRNLGKMTAIEAVKPLSNELKAVTSSLGDAEAVRKSRLHPLALLDAQRVYAQGHGDRGKLSWAPLAPITDALDGAFYAAFKNVVPTGKRVMLALDVSGSMAGSKVSGCNLSAREATAALALVQAATERPEDTFIMGFTSGFVPLAISPKQRLSDVVRHLNGLPFDATDCALPIYHALDHGIEVDAFVVYTDSETWAGRRGHPAQALREYREKMGIDAKLVVCAMTASRFTIADPQDKRMLDVVGFDTATPALIADFIRD